MRIKKINRKKNGFTLVELLIASSLSLVILGIITNFIFRFTSYSNKLSEQNDLSNELRTTNLRLEKEIEQCSAILKSYNPPTDYKNALPIETATTIYTDANRIILSRRILDKTTYMPVVNGGEIPTNTDKNDVIIIEYTGNASTTPQYGKLLISVIPPATNPGSNYFASTRIIKKTLISTVFNSSTDKTTDPGYTQLIPFVYFNSKTDFATTPAGITGSSLPEATEVRIKLFGKKEYGGFKVRQNYSHDISLKNFKKTTFN